MPNRWNSSIVTRLVLGLILGTASCGLLYPVLREAAIATISLIARALDPSTRVAEVVARVWSSNVYILWLAWLCAAAAIAIDWVPDRNKWKAILINGAGEAAILVIAFLLLVQAHTAADGTLLRNLAGLLVFATLALPALALRRHTEVAPTRVFDAK